MKFCPYCGKPLDGNFAFCPICGKKLDKTRNDNIVVTNTIDMGDYYGILGVSHSATESEIKTAFRNIAKKCHPDVNGGNKDLTEKFRKAAEAYEVLNDRNSRLAYDEYWSRKSSGDNTSDYFNEDYMDDVQREAQRTEAHIHAMFESLKDSRKEAVVSIFIGLGCIAAGLIITLGSMWLATEFGGRGIITVGLLICGAIGAIRSFYHAIVLSIEISNFKKTFWDSL